MTKRVTYKPGAYSQVLLPDGARIFVQVRPMAITVRNGKNGNGARPRLWSLADLRYFLQLSKSTVLRDVKEGFLPPPCCRRLNSPFWNPDEVIQWLRNPPDRAKSKYNK
jgi:hypothetical protein